MTDTPVFQVLENTPEQVAYRLTREIWALEGESRSRKEYLDLFAECMLAVRRPEARVGDREKSKTTFG